MSERRMLSLAADCGSCFGLCCVALPFAASRDFAFDKAAGEPCRHLATDFRCGIHDRLRAEGLAGCTRYDCFGAGQWVSQVTFAGRDWRAAPTTASQMYAVFGVVRQLHEMLVYLAEAMTLRPARALRGDIADARDETARLSGSSAATLLALDVATHRDRVRDLLVRASRLCRTGRGGADLVGADLVGADLRRARLRGADMRGAHLIAADLAGADLRDADLIGADLRDADLCGADLRGALFLTQPQLDAARGDAATTLPSRIRRPMHWPR